MVDDDTTASLAAIEKDLATIKKALGIVIAGAMGAHVQVSPDLLEELGLKQQRIVPATVLGS